MSMHTTAVWKNGGELPKLGLVFLKMFTFNVKPKWIFVSDYTIAMLIFEDNFSKASLRLNFSDVLKTGWAYYVKSGNSWKPDRIEINDIDL